MKTEIEEMWGDLAAYQPRADAAGHGETWARMCSARTATAVANAADAASVAADEAVAAARAARATADGEAADAAAIAAVAARAAADGEAVASLVQLVIDRIARCAK